MFLYFKIHYQTNIILDYQPKMCCSLVMVSNYLKTFMICNSSYKSCMKPNLCNVNHLRKVIEHPIRIYYNCTRTFFKAINNMDMQKCCNETLSLIERGTVWLTYIYQVMQQTSKCYYHDFTEPNSILTKSCVNCKF